jgi:predicted lipid-binding transport protein (Tim44 family)
MNLQTIQLLILAALAAVVLFSLYNVLGKRVGRQPEDVAIGPGPRRQEQVTSATVEPMDGVALSGLAALKARDPAFDVDGFLTGARSAHETIVKAFAGNDRRTLEGLTRADVFATFDNAIRERENAGVREAIEFLNPARADLESAEVEGDVVRLKVRFLSEFRSRRVATDGTVPTDDVAGAGAGDERRAAEAWTFERTLGGNDPTWALARVEAAEA